MLRFFLSAIAVALFAGAASAQPPEEVTVPEQDTIRLRTGQARIFQFEQTVNRVETPADNVVEIVPQSDRTFTFRGLRPGETIVTARSEDGRFTHRMLVVVGGRLVKIYGLTDNDDFAGFICDDRGCGHADTSNMASPDSQSVAVTGRDRGGNFVTQTKTYNKH